MAMLMLRLEKRGGSPALYALAFSEGATRLPRFFDQTPTANIHNINTMSDYEDDMDVDAPAVRDTITFSSDNTNLKGKRSAANLPVEAEDTLPW
jgi:hypothetical protein